MATTTSSSMFAPDHSSSCMYAGPPVASGDGGGDDEQGLRTCRGCSSTALRIDWAAGDRVCTNCGLVDEERLLEEKPEWREFDDDNDVVRNALSGGSGPGRCGLIPNNESRWIGGLQPTSLSKHIFGRPTNTSHTARKQLVKANQRMDRLMEKKHAHDLQDAKLSMQIRKRKRAMKKHGDYDDDDEDDYVNDDEGQSVRPELEHLLVREEESTLAAKAALYSDKWSLDRAIRMFGSGHEIDCLGPDHNQSLSNSHPDDNDGDRLRKKLDNTLTNASRDLYTAYSMLQQCAQRLQVPDRIRNEACSTLCKYAARKDGLTVRGVSTQFKSPSKKMPTKQPMPNTIKGRNIGGGSMNEEEKKARESLREFNKQKQMGSLVAAIMFYTARNLHCSRSLVQVCNSVDTPDTVKDFLTNVVAARKDEPFIKKKHCSKAMNEIKQVFPDFARTMAGVHNAALGGGGGGSGGENCSAMGGSGPQDAWNEAATASTANCVEHMARKLQLPPVAEASMLVLVLECEKQDDNAPESTSQSLLLDTRKRFTLCAAVSYFVCQMGEIMQNLAEQASASDNARPVIVARKKRKQDQKRLEGSSSSSSKKKSVEPSWDIFNDQEAAEAAAEQKAYEMRRVWDAWREQTTWKRQPAEIERIAGVSLTSIEEYFKTRLYPRRKALLDTLAGKAKLRAVDVGLESAMEGHLKNVPLASVLLPHVAIAEPLMKETIRKNKGLADLPS